MKIGKKQRERGGKCGNNSLYVKLSCRCPCFLLYECCFVILSKTRTYVVTYNSKILESMNKYRDKTRILIILSLLFSQNVNNSSSCSYSSYYSHLLIVQFTISRSALRYATTLSFQYIYLTFLYCCNILRDNTVIEKCLWYINNIQTY